MEAGADPCRGDKEMVGGDVKGRQGSGRGLGEEREVRFSWWLNAVKSGCVICLC